jgi:hypothetical protein
MIFLMQGYGIKIKQNLDDLSVKINSGKIGVIYSNPN